MKNFFLIIFFILMPAWFFYKFHTKDEGLNLKSSNFKEIKNLRFEKKISKDNIGEKKSIDALGKKETRYDFHDMEKTQERIPEFNIHTSFENFNYYERFLDNFHRGEYKKVKILGENLLKIPDTYARFYWYGNLVHTTNIILGKVFLIDGNIPKSEFYLLNSVNQASISKTSGGIYSPQLSTFGPDTTLALDLYIAGRRRTVLNYFQNLKSFWEVGKKNGYIDNSIKNIRSGLMPSDLEQNISEISEERKSGFPFVLGPNRIPFE